MFISAGRTKEVVVVRVVSMEGNQGPVEFVSNGEYGEGGVGMEGGEIWGGSGLVRGVGFVSNG